MKPTNKSQPDAEFIVFVDEHGQPTGEIGPKLASHTAHTRLHLAFSCYVFNDMGQFLVTKRAYSKKVWPGVWTNSVCGHPGPDESVVKAIRRRLEFELGMGAKDIQVILPNYTYKTPPYNGIIEHEFCPAYIAHAVGHPMPNPDEVERYRWTSWQEYVEAVETDITDQYSWWCKDQLRLIRDNHLIREYIQTSD